MLNVENSKLHMIMRPQTYSLTYSIPDLQVVKPTLATLRALAHLYLDYLRQGLSRWHYRIWESSYGLSWLGLTIELWESPLAQRPPVLKLTRRDC
jgi:hypothetical protein